MIAARDWRAVDQARALGPPATAEAGAQLSSADAEVRFLALHCVLAAGGPETPRWLLKCLSDEDEQTQNTAAKALLEHPPRDLEAEAFVTWDRQTNPTVRYYLALSLGLTGAAAQPGLQQRLAGAGSGQPPSTTDSLVGALARLRDREARAALRQMLSGAFASRIPAVLEVFRYVDDPALAKFLRPLMGHLEDAVDLSTHATEFSRRGCDLAIDELARIAPGKLSFPANTSVRYNPSQIAEATRYLDSLPDPN